MKNVHVTVTGMQLQLIDRVIGEGGLGSSRAEVLRATLLEHARFILSGGGIYETGGWNTIEIEKPAYGPKRYDHILQPVTGKALPVYRGEVLRITQVEGGQCVDFNAYNLHDYKEYLDCGFNLLEGVFTGKGTIVWTGSPRARPMYVILEMSETCDQYYGGHRCHGLLYERRYGLVHHPNCQDTFAEAIREYGLTPDDVHASYNLWMSNAVTADGQRYYPWARGQEGDYCDFLALFDTLAVPIICGDDIRSINKFEPTSVQISVFEPTQETLSFVDRIEDSLTGYTHQQTAGDFKLKQIRAERELKQDPDYQPDYRPAPERTTIDVELAAAEQAICDGLLATGEYGTTAGKAIIASFCRWFELNRVPERYTKLMIQD